MICTAYIHKFKKPGLFSRPFQLAAFRVTKLLRIEYAYKKVYFALICKTPILISFFRFEFRNLKHKFFPFFSEQRSKCSKNRTRRRLFRGLRPAFKSPWSCPGGRRSSHQGLQKKAQTTTIFPFQRSSGIWKHYSQQEKIQ